MKEILDMILKARSGKKTTEMYRGTVEPEIVVEFKEAKQALITAQEAYEAKHKALWDRICMSLSLPPEGDYDLNWRTGQVFENISIEELETGDE